MESRLTSNHPVTAEQELSQPEGIVAGLCNEWTHAIERPRTIVNSRSMDILFENFSAPACHSTGDGAGITSDSDDMLENRTTVSGRVTSRSAAQFKPRHPTCSDPASPEPNHHHQPSGSKPISPVFVLLHHRLWQMLKNSTQGLLTGSSKICRRHPAF
jgi:hypothetical protein